MTGPHRFLPATDETRRAMLETIGTPSVDELFRGVPRDLRLTEPLDIPGPLSEREIRASYEALARRSLRPGVYAAFLGAGAYRHEIPSAVPHLLSRSEFYSCYTPYQPELAQGTLQSIFEFQSLLCLLTGMEVANASLYDGSTALAEAALLALRSAGGDPRAKRILLSRAVHPEYREVVRTYLRPSGVRIEEVPLTGSGQTDRAALQGMLGPDVVCLAVQNPNFLGRLEDLRGISADLDAAPDAFYVAAVAEPYSLGLVRPPGEFGADVVVGETQAFGVPLSYGGPYCGFFATRDEWKRSIPGRLVGETLDVDGRTGYVLTLATREQHIRREKATSNICTNEGLMMTASTMALCLLGKEGLREAALQCLEKAHALRDRLLRVPGVRPLHAGEPAPFFNEFVLRLPRDPREVLWGLLENHILGGVPLAGWYPELSDAVLVTATECTTREEIERYATALEAVLGGAR